MPKLPCGCPNPQSCWHGPCIPGRKLRWGQQIIENAYGHIMAADLDKIVVHEDGSVSLR